MALSIILPAHNEEAAIGRSIERLTSSPGSSGWQIIVVCNACIDRSEEIARSYEPRIEVIATDVPGKTNALNLGDAQARYFPRAYIDADVEIAVESLEILARTLRRGPILAVAPRAAADLSKASWAVRAFYAIRDHLPSSNEGIGSSGVYMLSEDGRKRFGPFPDVIADDLFVRTRFSAAERATIPSITSTVHPPRTLPSLIAIRTRAHLGNAQLKRDYALQWGARGDSNMSTLAKLAARPSNWAGLAVYLYVSLRSKAAAKRRLRTRNLSWDRDVTSRQSV